MPSAVPIPRGPSHLVLFGAEDLLRGADCPVCRYESEADDRFTGWFALEAHADPGMINRLSQSLGMCPMHTRGAVRQTGAETRMTAVYRYLLPAAAAYLTTRRSPQVPCPGCAHGAEAMIRAVDTLLTALRYEEFRAVYRDTGGLCLPHLRTALPRSSRRLGSWLANDLAARLAGAEPDLAKLAGNRDADAELRTRLRAALPTAPASADTEERWVCPVCLIAAQAERGALAQADTTGWCPAHLYDTCSSGDAGCSEPRSQAALRLARQAGESAAWLVSRTAPGGQGTVLRRLTSRGGQRRGRASEPGCPACDAASAAATQAGASLHGPQLRYLCLRHVMALRPRDPRRTVAAEMAARRTESVLRELEEALAKRVWARRHEPQGAERTAWRRAAALIDGRVYGGGPPGPL